MDGSQKSELFTLTNIFVLEIAEGGKEIALKVNCPAVLVDQLRQVKKNMFYNGFVEL